MNKTRVFRVQERIGIVKSAQSSVSRKVDVVPDLMSVKVSIGVIVVFFGMFGR